MENNEIQSSDSTNETFQGKYDSPWKYIIGLYFKDFMSYFFPEVFKDIDWAVPYEFLDKEFETFIDESEMDKCLADKLVKVRRL
ncbi:MAG: hypothetical protein HQM08_16200, partial [Candidatus Riflebacteria bacterium]|nr:hypothetical protein [Candidatus Riflebacteria bacterium]